MDPFRERGYYSYDPDTDSADSADDNDGSGITNAIIVDSMTAHTKTVIPPSS